MDCRVSLLAVAVLFLVFSSASAFNITRLLGRFPEFSVFNDLLTQTHLNEQINSRQTITILAVANDGIGAISGKPLDVQKRILSNHVILDYFDTLKLQRLKESSLLTTLYQSTGLAQRMQGFVNVSVTSSGIVFGSAIRGSPLNAKLLAGVAAQPFNISVMQVSSTIIAPGMDPSEPLPPVPSPKKETPAAAPVVEAPEAAASPEEPEAAAPVESLVESPADAPAPDEESKNKKQKYADDEEEEEEEEEDAPAPSSAARVVGAGLAIVMGLATSSAVQKLMFGI